MTYPILDPKHGIQPQFQGLCALAVMSKAPRPGTVKTRLCPPLTPLEAAELNTCFLQDTAENLANVAAQTGHAHPIISYTPVGDEALFDGLLPRGFHLLPQRGEDFSQRLNYTVEDALAMGFSSVCLIDSDSPTVPAAAYLRAVAELGRSGDRVVLGPSHDGGYFLIGLKAAHSAVFSDITWSSSQVAGQTRERCATAGLDVVELPLWYDVDDTATLSILESELLFGQPPKFASTKGYVAENTRKYLERRQAQNAFTAPVEEVFS